MKLFSNCRKKLLITKNSLDEVFSIEDLQVLLDASMQLETEILEAMMLGMPKTEILNSEYIQQLMEERRCASNREFSNILMLEKILRIRSQYMILKNLRQKFKGE